MRPRPYLISSARSTKPGHGTLTVSVVRSGVASSYLTGLREGDVVYAECHPNPVFGTLWTPKYREAPLIMIAVGAGLAPFRAVLQDLVARGAFPPAYGQVNNRVRPALLFYGCRGRHIDEMYADELDAAEEAGVVVVNRAYSREDSVKDGHKYVTDAVAAHTDAILTLCKGRGALVRVSPGKRVADAVWQILGPMLLESELESGKSMGTLDDTSAWRKHPTLNLPEWRQNLGLNNASEWEGRYVEEVF